MQLNLFTHYSFIHYLLKHNPLKQLTRYFSGLLNTLVVGLLISLILTTKTYAATPLIQQAYTLPGTYQAINLHDFVEEIRQSYFGKITIVHPQKISFAGVLKALPEKKSTHYLMTALKIREISPLPTIDYQMFIAALDDKKTVIPVYVDNTLADSIQQHLTINTQATWFGYHIYTYSRGPAIVIDNVVIDKLTKP